MRIYLLCRSDATCLSRTARAAPPKAQRLSTPNPPSPATCLCLLTGGCFSAHDASKIETINDLRTHFIQFGCHRRLVGLRGRIQELLAEQFEGHGEKLLLPSDHRSPAFFPNKIVCPSSGLVAPTGRTQARRPTIIGFELIKQSAVLKTEAHSLARTIKPARPWRSSPFDVQTLRRPL